MLPNTELRIPAHTPDMDDFDQVDIFALRHGPTKAMPIGDMKQTGDLSSIVFCNLVDVDTGTIHLCTVMALTTLDGTEKPLIGLRLKLEHETNGEIIQTSVTSGDIIFEDTGPTWRRHLIGDGTKPVAAGDKVKVGQRILCTGKPLEGEMMPAARVLEIEKFEPVFGYLPTFVTTEEPGMAWTQGKSHEYAFAMCKAGDIVMGVLVLSPNEAKRRYAEAGIEDSCTEIELV